MSTNKERALLQDVLQELRGIRERLDKLLLILPEEDLDAYENADEIKRAYADAVRLHAAE